jgi:hypothetical protein
LEIEHAILADYAALMGDGKLMVAGIFNIILVEGLPAVQTQLSLAFRLHSATGEDPSHSIMIRLVDPDGVSLIQDISGPIPEPTDDPSGGGYSQLVVNLRLVPFEREGPHSFDILIDGRYEHSIPLTVVRMTSKAIDTPTA